MDGPELTSPLPPSSSSDGRRRPPSIHPWNVNLEAGARPSSSDKGPLVHWRATNRTPRRDPTALVPATPSPGPRLPTSAAQPIRWLDQIGGPWPAASAGRSPFSMDGKDVCAVQCSAAWYLHTVPG